MFGINVFQNYLHLKYNVPIVHSSDHGSPLTLEKNTVIYALYIHTHNTISRITFLLYYHVFIAMITWSVTLHLWPRQKCEGGERNLLNALSEDYKKECIVFVSEWNARDHTIIDGRGILSNICSCMSVICTLSQKNHNWSTDR